MIQQNIKAQIITIWDKYLAENKKVQDTKGNDLGDIDNNRISAIQYLKVIVEKFLNNVTDIQEFKTEIDSFNKQNNLWGFTSIKGQMFFNLLVKTSEENTTNLTSILKNCVAKPASLEDALNKIEQLEKYTLNLYNKAPDKRKVPNPNSVCYFLSYFWQIHDHQKWPIMYSSIVTAFTEIGIWLEQPSQKDAYASFFNLNDEVKQILSAHTGKSISNWDAEHAFWNLRPVEVTPKQPSKPKNDKIIIEKPEQVVSALREASFNIYDFIPPIAARLVELGAETESSASAKGSKFEKAVYEVFKQLGFVVQLLGQGSGREPDLIAIHKEDNVAFIIDAKAYPNGYMLSAGDERAIKEYINHHCPKLQKEGIKKIGFIIVSNSFKSGFDNFINEITWKTDIKRFCLINSDALLHLLAYKIKDQLPNTDIIEAIISLGSTITAQDIIQKFDDI